MVLLAFVSRSSLVLTMVLVLSSYHGYSY